MIIENYIRLNTKYKYLFWTIRDKTEAELSSWFRGTPLANTNAPVYIDFVNGNDANVGSMESPVKTIDRAKSIVDTSGATSKYYAYIVSPFTGKIEYTTAHTFTLMSLGSLITDNTGDFVNIAFVGCSFKSFNKLNICTFISADFVSYPKAAYSTTHGPMSFSDSRVQKSIKVARGIDSFFKDSVIDIGTSERMSNSLFYNCEINLTNISRWAMADSNVFADNCRFTLNGSEVVIDGHTAKEKSDFLTRYIIETLRFYNFYENKIVPSSEIDNAYDLNMLMPKNETVSFLPIDDNVYETPVIELAGLASIRTTLKRTLLHGKMSLFVKYGNGKNALSTYKELPINSELLSDNLKSIYAKYIQLKIVNNA